MWAVPEPGCGATSFLQNALRRSAIVVLHHKKKNRTTVSKQNYYIKTELLYQNRTTVSTTAIAQAGFEVNPKSAPSRQKKLIRRSCTRWLLCMFTFWYFRDIVHRLVIREARRPLTPQIWSHWRVASCYSFAKLKSDYGLPRFAQHKKQWSANQNTTKKRNKERGSSKVSTGEEGVKREDKKHCTTHFPPDALAPNFLLGQVVSVVVHSDDHLQTHNASGLRRRSSPHAGVRKLVGNGRCAVCFSLNTPPPQEWAECGASLGCVHVISHGPQPFALTSYHMRRRVAFGIGWSMNVIASRISRPPLRCPPLFGIAGVLYRSPPGTTTSDLTCCEWKNSQKFSTFCKKLAPICKFWNENTGQGINVHFGSSTKIRNFRPNVHGNIWKINW